MYVALYFFLVAVLAETTPENDITVKTRACLPPHDIYPFCNVSLSIDERVKDLISRLHPDEKPHLLTARNGGGGSPGPGSNISRLGLPEYDWGVNCVHGAQTNCIELKDKSIVCPTSFINPVNLGMTFNTSHMLAMGRVIATELRALWLLGATEDSAWSGRPHAGLDCWSPNINIARDPRWGRNQETTSEDPFVNGEYGYWITRGLQEGEDPRYTKVIVTIKHWDAYSLEDSDGFTRHNFNAVVSNYTLHTTYIVAFKKSVQSGRAKGVMCSYNALNGIPTCANPVLTSFLDDWNFQGYVTSDTGALSDIFREHKYVKTGAEAACKALTDGRCDINSGAVYHDHLLQGVSQGLCTMDDVDKALYHTIRLRFELGLFDPIESQPYWHIGPEAIGTQATKDLNMLSTLESMVLLKNANDALPFPTGKTVALIGPHGKAQAAMVGNYLGQLCPHSGFSCIKTPYQAIQEINKGGRVIYEQGCSVQKNDTSGFQAAINAAKQADYVILLMGIDESVEAEAHDRVTISLPPIQQKLVTAIMNALKGMNVAKHVVLVVLNGGMLALEMEKAQVPAILEAGYPGMLGGDAIARTIFGQNNNLGGKLPYTMYPANYVNEVKMSYMEMAPKKGVSPGRTYRYYTGPTVYPFGYGLSLTKFKLGVNCTGAHFVSSASPASISVNVTNVGNRIGDEVVMLYWIPPSEVTAATGLLKQLVAYSRVHLSPRGSKKLHFSLDVGKFSPVDIEEASKTHVVGATSHIEVTNGVDQSTFCTVTLRH